MSNPYLLRSKKTDIAQKLQKLMEERRQKFNPQKYLKRLSVKATNNPLIPRSSRLQNRIVEERNSIIFLPSRKKGFLLKKSRGYILMIIFGIFMMMLKSNSRTQRTEPTLNNPFSLHISADGGGREMKNQLTKWAKSTGKLSLSSSKLKVDIQIVVGTIKNANGFSSYGEITSFRNNKTTTWKLFQPPQKDKILSNKTLLTQIKNKLIIP